MNLTVWMAEKVEQPSLTLDLQFVNHFYLLFNFSLFLLCRHLQSILNELLYNTIKHHNYRNLFGFRFWLRFLFHWIWCYLLGPSFSCFLSTTKHLSYSSNSLHMSGPLDRFARPCEYQYLQFFYSQFSQFYAKITFLRIDHLVSFFFLSASLNRLQLWLN